MTSDRLLAVSKEVIRQGAEIGLDLAGKTICGPAWPFVQKILSPVIDALQKGYPKLFLLDDRNAADTGEKAAAELSNNPTLQKMLDDGLLALKEGQEEILHLLAKNDDTLQTIGKSIDRGFQDAQRNNDDANARVMAELRSIRQLLQVRTASAPRAPTTLSPQEVDRRANGYQADAMQWINAGDADTASERLSQGRDLLRAALQMTPNNPRMLASLGFIEKSQAQVEFLKRHQEDAVTSLGEAAKYFTAALEQDPNEISALNGVANIYYYAGDYDRAINIGRLVVEREPTYGAALFDLSLALEGKMKAVGPQPALLEALRAVYQMLEQRMPLEPQTFPASYLAYVQQRLAEVNKLSPKADTAP
jgi:tetratricopeptide (TPR) repeat protein